MGMEITSYLFSPALWSMVTMFNTLVFISGVFIWAFNRQTQIRPSKSQKPQHRDYGHDGDGEDHHVDDIDIDLDPAHDHDNGDIIKNDIVMNREEAMQRSSIKELMRRESIALSSDRETSTNLYFNDWSRYDERKHLVHSFMNSELDTSMSAEQLEDSDDDDGNADDEESRDGDDEFEGISEFESTSTMKTKTVPPPQQQKEMRKHLFRSISRLKVFSYLSDDAFLQCLSFMEYVNLSESGSELFTDEKPFDGSFYVVIEGSMKIQCVLSRAFQGQGEGKGRESQSRQPIEFTAGPGEVLISFLSVMSGLVDKYQMINGGKQDSEMESEGAIIADEDQELESDGRREHEKKQKQNHHGHVVDVRAQSSQPNTRLIRVPPSAFVFMLQKHPHDVHLIAQTILARSQRITIQTLVNNLGLGFDLLYNHGNKVPMKCDSRSILPSMDEEDMELNSIALDVLLECGEGHRSMNEASPSEEKEACIRTLEIKDEDLNRRLSRWVANSLGSTSQKCMDIIRQDAVLISVPPGKVLIDTETKAECVYFVIDGSLEVGSTSTHAEKVDNSKQRSSLKMENKTANQNEHVTNDDHFQLLYNVLQGDTVGQMSCFTNEVSFVTVRASAGLSQNPTMLLKLPKTTYCSLAGQFSGVLVQCVNKILTVDFSPLVHLFDWGLQWKNVQAGMLLATKGETCDQLQVILSGRLKSGFRDTAGDAKEFGRGTCMGLTHVITRGEWPEDIYAIRNSEIAIIPANVLEYLMHLFPQTAVHVAKLIAKKAQKKRHKATSAFSALGGSDDLSVATIAIVPLCFDSTSDAQELCEFITTKFEKIAPCKLMSRSIARQYVGRRVFQTRNAVHEQKLSRLFCDIEESSRLTVYQADAKFTWWTKLCIQQADHVLLVVKANSAPRCRQLEKYLSWASEKLMVRHIKVLILQDVDAGNIDGNSNSEPVGDELNEWIEKQRWIEGQHLARLPFDVHDMDIARLCRRITGRSLGLALGGGGARGLAHIGVIRALMERNVTVDVCGGTSQGAFVGALYAKSPDSYEDLVKNCRIMADNMASINKKLLDLTLPIVSYFNGVGFDNQIIQSIGKTTKFSDLILEFFCISTDLYRSSQVIHTKGLCWKYIRASMSLCGYLPPVSEDGKLLADGGYTNLVPGDILIEQMNAKAAICVDVAKENPSDYYEYGTHISGLWLLLNSLNPFAKTVRVPSMGDLSQRLIWVSAFNHRRSLVDKVDLFLSPPVGNYGTLEFDKFDEIVEVGYQYAKPRVDAFISENPWVVSS